MAKLDCDHWRDFDPENWARLRRLADGLPENWTINCGLGYAVNGVPSGGFDVTIEVDGRVVRRQNTFPSFRLEAVAEWVEHEAPLVKRELE